MPYLCGINLWYKGGCKMYQMKLKRDEKGFFYDLTDDNEIGQDCKKKGGEKMSPEGRVVTFFILFISILKSLILRRD